MDNIINIGLLEIFLEQLEALEPAFEGNLLGIVADVFDSGDLKLSDDDFRRRHTLLLF